MINGQPLTFLIRSKEKAIVENIDFPSELLDVNQINKYYENLEAISSKDHFENERKYSKFYTNKALSKLYQKFDKNDWKHHTDVLKVNAGFNIFSNAMAIPTGILEEPFFSKDLPAYMNYGALGWIVGHEITHGFDDQGKQFDENNKFIDWWQPGAKQK